MGTWIPPRTILTPLLTRSAMHPTIGSNLRFWISRVGQPIINSMIHTQHPQSPHREKENLGIISTTILTRLFNRVLWLIQDPGSLALQLLQTHNLSPNLDGTRIGANQILKLQIFLMFLFLSSMILSLMEMRMTTMSPSLRYLPSPHQLHLRVTVPPNSPSKKSGDLQRGQNGTLQAPNPEDALLKSRTRMNNPHEKAPRPLTRKDINSAAPEEGTRSNTQEERIAQKARKYQGTPTIWLRSIIGHASMVNFRLFWTLCLRIWWALRSKVTWEETRTLRKRSAKQRYWCWQRGTLKIWSTRIRAYLVTIKFCKEMCNIWKGFGSGWGVRFFHDYEYLRAINGETKGLWFSFSRRRMGLSPHRFEQICPQCLPYALHQRMQDLIKHEYNKTAPNTDNHNPHSTMKPM